MLHRVIVYEMAHVRIEAESSRSRVGCDRQAMRERAEREKGESSKEARMERASCGRVVDCESQSIAAAVPLALSAILARPELGARQSAINPRTHEGRSSEPRCARFCMNANERHLIVKLQFRV